MNKILFDNNTFQFGLYQVVESVTQAAELNLVLSGTLHQILDYQITLLCDTIVGDCVHSNQCRKECRGLTYVFPVKKSASRKSVRQYSAKYGQYIGEKINLPEKFRDRVFRSIVAVKKGPFTKRRINDQLVDVEPWYTYEVVFAGNNFDCIFEIIKYEIETFNLNEICQLFLASTCTEQIDFILKSVNEDFSTESYKTQIKEAISLAHKKANDALLIDLETSEEGYDILKELGDEEERKMDDETNGDWRWNID